MAGEPNVVRPAYDGHLKKTRWNDRYGGLKGGLYLNVITLKGAYFASMIEGATVQSRGCPEFCVLGHLAGNCRINLNRPGFTRHN